MFRKEGSLKKVVDDSTTIVNDFKLSIPYWSYRPTDYCLSEWIITRRPEIDADLSELWSRESIDDGNDDVMDPKIDDWIEMEKAGIDSKRVNNRELNRNFDMKAKSAEITFNMYLKYCKAELSKTNSRIEKYEEMILEMEERRK